MLFARFESKYAPDHARNALPVLLFKRKSLDSAFGNRVKPRPTVVFGNAPLCCNPASLLQPQQ
jgi:hypothetical protein